MRDVVATGGVCDSYQPAEETLQITHKLLQIFADTGFALSMSTKSKLILRDCDLLNEIANKTWCAIGVSISTVDDHWASILEPRAANVKDRFEVVKTLKEKCPKAYVGINFMPIIPFISDSIQNIEKTIRLAAEAKADYVLFGVGVTLRDRQREFFFDKMKEYPEIVKMIKNLHSSTKEEWKRYALPKNRLIRDLSEKYKIKIRIPRYIPSDWRRLNYLISEKLFHVAYIKSLEFENQYSEQSVAHYINSLPEPIETIINSKRLDSIPHITEPIKKLILSFEPKPTGLDRFMQYQS